MAADSLGMRTDGSYFFDAEKVMTVGRTAVTFSGRAMFRGELIEDCLRDIDGALPDDLDVRGTLDRIRQELKQRSIGDPFIGHDGEPVRTVILCAGFDGGSVGRLYLAQVPTVEDEPTLIATTERQSAPVFIGDKWLLQSLCQDAAITAPVEPIDDVIRVAARMICASASVQRLLTRWRQTNEPVPQSINGPARIAIIEPSGTRFESWSCGPYRNDDQSAPEV